MKKIFSAALAVFLSVAVLVTFTPFTGETVYGASKLKSPTLTAKVSDDEALLDWNEVSSAKSYTVFVKNGKQYKKVVTLSDTEYTAKDLAAKKNYVFKVKANGKSGGKYSNAVTVNISYAGDSRADLFEDAQDLYSVSSEATKYADEVSRELAFNPEYWDSDEGWRTAGSDAEHKAAEYLANEWKKIGLEDVTLDPVKLDKLQFNYAKLDVTCEDANKNISLGDTGTDKLGCNEDMSVISYAISGTKEIIKDKNLSDDYFQNLDIVDMGEGTELEYLKYYGEHPELNNSMKGKVVLVGLNQMETVWITQSLSEAWAQGADGIISYQTAGYGQYSEDTNHVQDVCCKDLQIPCLGISKANADAIKEAIKAGNAKVSLNTSTEVDVNGGTSYNVVGKIKGTGKTGQQIIYAGHYDKYFYGLEDDCAAVGLVAGIAKAMVDSEYRPVNDILFIAHGAEEWGESGTDFDWATGSYREIVKHPEWQGTTLTMLNFELPAIDNGKTQCINSSVETVGLANDMLESGILEDSAKEKNGYDYETAYKSSSFTYADIVGYEEYGVPGHMNNLDTREVGGWFGNRYHTQNDTINEDETMFGKLFKGSPSIGDGSYSLNMMNSQLDVYAALGMTYDQTPAVVLDFSSRCDQLLEGIENLSVTAKEKKAFKSAVAKLRKAAKANEKAGEKINAKYAAACLSGDVAGMKAAKKAAVKYNKNSLKAFKAVQQKLISIDIGGLYLDVSHNLIQNNLSIYDYVCKTLKGLNGDPENDLNVAYEALYGPGCDYSNGACLINGWFEWCYGMRCGEDALNMLATVFNNDKNNWGKCVQLVGGLENAWLTSHDLFLYSEGYNDSCDLKKVSKEYNGYLKIHKKQLKSTLKKETKSINSIANAL